MVFSPVCLSQFEIKNISHMIEWQSTRLLQRAQASGASGAVMQKGGEGKARREIGKCSKAQTRHRSLVQIAKIKTAIL